MSAALASILSPQPASISTVRSPRTSSGRMPMRMRFRPSAGATRSQSGFGTTPNIAPPSSMKKPSLSGTSSRLPSVIEGSATSVAVPPRVRPASTRPARSLGREALYDVTRRGVRIQRARGDLVDHRGKRLRADFDVHPCHEAGREQLAQAKLAPGAPPPPKMLGCMPSEALDGLRQRGHACTRCCLGLEDRRAPLAGRTRLEAQHPLHSGGGAVRTFPVGLVHH